MNSDTTLRNRALQRLVSGEITRSEYEAILAEIDRLQAASAPVPPPVYVPDLADREGVTVAGIPVPPALKAGSLLDKYELKSSKRGGMGEVWEAWDAKIGRRVAIKLLPQELRGNTEEIARIHAQFKLVEQLDHTHICRLFDLNEHPVWGWYEVMRWIDGETLAEIASKAGGKLPLREVIELLTPAAAALDYAHGRGILHRDVKPLNMMRSREGLVQVIDFGLAAEVRGSLSRVSRKFDGLSGTPQYLAPELWNEAPESPQSDQYALAVTAYELLAGRPPFKTDNLGILMARIQTAEVPVIDGISDSVISVLHRALAKEREERFATCGEFVNALSNPPGQSELNPAPVVRVQLASTVASPPSPTTSRGSQPARLRSPFNKAEAEAGQLAWATHLGRQVYEKNSVGMEFALIPPGSFQMGCPNTEEELFRTGNTPVTLTRPYWLGRTPVTREQWTTVMGTEPWPSEKAPNWLEQLFGAQPPSKDRNLQHPATEISWEDATEYCHRITERDGGNWTYRLPSEAEWEWACRAGTLTAYWFGNELNGTKANCRGDSPYGTSKEGPVRKGTTEVGSYGVNPFGLWDMHGNVSEWCADVYQLELAGGENPEVKLGDSDRVTRGGSWRSWALYCRSTSRHGCGLRDRRNDLGFRVLAVPSPR